MKLTGKYRLIVEGDIDKMRTGYSTKLIGYLFERLLTGQEADMNLDHMGITVRVDDESRD